jgi:succinate dehydrogenase / fumarate reductase cytochrome b subunit
MYHPDRGAKSMGSNALPGQVFGTYRWFTGSLAYVLHRVTGLGLVFFIFFHILSVTKATSADPSHYDLMIRRMQEPDFKLGEIMLYAALLFHGINGIRILLVDFIIERTAIHKTLFWAFTAIILILLVAGTIPLVLHTNVKAFFYEALPGGAY